MSNYTKITDYAAKDAYLTGDPLKKVKGVDIGADFDAVSTAIATKADLASPTLVTPTLGVATATSINKISFTKPATGATVTIADGKTLTVSKTLTLDGTDGTTHTLPATNSTLARTDAAQTFTGNQRFNGSLGIGGAAAADTSVYQNWNATGAVTTYGTRSNVTVLSDVTTTYSNNISAVNTQGAAFTLTNLQHYAAQEGTFNAPSVVTNQYGFIASASLTGATNNYGFYGNIASAANRFNAYMAGTAPNYFAGTIASLGSYNATTAVSANMAIASDGAITRATSSLRYKTDVETLESARADAVVLGSRPVWYRSTCDNDNHSWGWYGLIAEELAEIDPRLVHWGRPSKEVEIPATETEPASVTNVEDTDAPLRPEGVMYDRLTVMLLDVVKRQQATIDALTVRVEALEA